MKPTETNLPRTALEQRIHELRGHNVMLDHDLAGLYAVQVKVLNQAVRRNADRFPPDFMFQLTYDEATRLRSEEASPDSRRGGRRYLPFAFTEEGVAMLSSVQFKVVFEAIRQLTAPRPGPAKVIGFRADSED